MKYVLLLGRILYSALFILASVGHFSQQTVNIVADQGIPMASFLVPLSGVIILIGGISVLIGFKARWGVWLLVIFLIVTTLTMHQFWNLDPSLMMEMQKAMFFKNISLLGAALMIAYFGSGPFSMDNIHWGKSKKKR